MASSDRTLTPGANDRVLEVGRPDAMAVQKFLAPRPITDGGGLEAAIVSAIATCGGDLRATVRALIIANAFLEEELMRVRALPSRGYVRCSLRSLPR